MSWTAPLDGWVVLNTDGPSLGSPDRAGVGGVVRDAIGRWVFGYTGFIGVSEFLKAELLVVLFGLQSCWDRGIRQLILYTDSMVVLAPGILGLLFPCLWLYH